MTNNVTFPTELGGDGFTYTDGITNGAVRGLSGGGHRDNFVPTLQNTVAMAASAKASADAAAFSLDTFDDRFLGAKVADPLADNDGNPLILGAIYFRTTTPQEMRVYTSLGWKGIGSYTTGDIRLQGSLWSDTQEHTLSNIGPVNNTYILDIDLFNDFKLEVNGNLQLSFNNTSVNVVEFNLDLVRTATATVTFPTSVRWSGGLAPSFNLDKRYLLNFYSNDGGLRWLASVKVSDAAL